METPSSNILRMEGDSFWFHELGILLSAVAISSLAADLHRTPVSFFFFFNVILLTCLRTGRTLRWPWATKTWSSFLVTWTYSVTAWTSTQGRHGSIRVGWYWKKSRYFCQPWCSPGEFGKTSSYESEKPLFWPQPWHHENQLTDLDRPTDRDGSWRIFLRDPMSGTFQSCRWMELLNGSAAWIIKHLKTYEDI